MGNHSTSLGRYVLHDLERITAFTADEIRDYYRDFLKRCPENSISMDKNTFSGYYTEVFPDDDASSFSDYVFRVFDSDGNGRIDFREFILALSINRKGTVEEKLHWLFNMVDLDGGGSISRDELVQVIDCLNRMQKEPPTVPAKQLADDIFHHSDTDSNNTLSLDEFILSAVTLDEMETLLEGTVLAVAEPIQRTQSTAKKS